MERGEIVVVDNFWVELREESSTNGNCTSLNIVLHSVSDATGEDRDVTGVC